MTAVEQAVKALVTRITSWLVMRLDADGAQHVLGLLAAVHAGPWLRGQAWLAGYDAARLVDGASAGTVRTAAPWWVTVLPEYRQGIDAALAELTPTAGRVRARHFDTSARSLEGVITAETQTAQLRPLSAETA